jgi:hypothetical protein
MHVLLPEAELFYLSTKIVGKAYHNAHGAYKLSENFANPYFHNY